MRTLSAALAEHLEGDATTMCHCWRVTRRDGAVLGFTEHDHDLSFGGTDFWAASGFQPADGEVASGLSVEAGEVTGGFSNAAISELDVVAGRYDGARVEVFQVNWQAPDQRILLRVQEIGDVVRAGGAFRAELRRLTHRLDQVQGRIYGRRCDAVLGDRRCTVDLNNPAYRGSGAVVVLNAAVRPLGLTADEAGRVIRWIAEPGGQVVTPAGPYAFAGGLRAETPVAPVHLRARRIESGGIRITWVRCARRDADHWLDGDIALDEPQERYRIDILDGAIVKRSLDVTEPALHYAAGLEIEDFSVPQAALSVRVRQRGQKAAFGVAAQATLTL